MKNIIVTILIFNCISCDTQEKKNEQKPKNFIVTYQKNGETVTDTVAIKDTILRNELQRMMTDPNYKPRTPENDTVFNVQGNPTLVRLNDDIFGASIQKFEYDNSNRLIKITGFDNQDKIKPFYHDIAIQLYKYDQNENLAEIRLYGEDGNLISSEFEDTPIIRMNYNDKNQLIEKWFLDENENLRSKFAIIKYEYGKEGEQISKGWFNKKGEKKE